MVITALLTCHNRSAHTLACIQSLGVNALPPSTILQIVVVDAGSTDGTPALLESTLSKNPHFHLLRRSDSMFWAAGMREAYLYAATILPADYFLYLNDDVILEPDAIIRLLGTSADADSFGREAIIVGTTRDPQTFHATYGGRIRRGYLHPTQFDLVTPGSSSIPCHTLNMNIALIPKPVAAVCGGIDKGFSHAMGDFDYGLRARRAGFRLLVGPGFYGTCRRDHDIHGTWHDASAPIRRRLYNLNSTKHLPFRQWALFCRRHTGLVWVLVLGWPTAKVLWTSLMHFLRARTASVIGIRGCPKRRAEDQEYRP